MICFAPLVMAGYLFTMQPNQSHVTNMDGGLLEVQTCEQGLGLQGKASTSGLYGLGAHYGMQIELGQFALTVQPFGGVSYVDHPVHELPQRTQFEIGAELLVSYKQARVGVQYWHLSNAGMTRPNIGLDMIGVTMGWSF